MEIEINHLIREEHHDRYDENLPTTWPSGAVLVFFELLALRGALSAEDIAKETGAHIGFVTHWLKEQVTFGLVEEAQSKERAYFRPTTNLFDLLKGTLTSNRFRPPALVAISFSLRADDCCQKQPR